MRTVDAGTLHRCRQICPCDGCAALTNAARAFGAGIYPGSETKPRTIRMRPVASNTKCRTRRFGVKPVSTPPTMRQSRLATAMAGTLTPAHGFVSQA